MDAGVPAHWKKGVHDGTKYYNGTENYGTGNAGDFCSNSGYHAGHDRNTKVFEERGEKGYASEVNIVVSKWEKWYNV